jgi:hypothetical protein
MNAGAIQAATEQSETTPNAPKTPSVNESGRWLTSAPNRPGRVERPRPNGPTAGSFAEKGMLPAVFIPKNGIITDPVQIPPSRTKAV